MADIDAIAIPSAGFVPELGHLFDLQELRYRRDSWARRGIDLLRRGTKRTGVKPPLYFTRFPAKRETEVIHVEHHLAHAASAYFTSGNSSRQLVVTIDGIGDGVCVGIWRGEGGRL